ncbi:TPA: hypothetical protein U1C15_001513 [Streptococcus suis]|nr:hypothetical protein [Streptococcus suis]
MNKKMKIGLLYTLIILFLYVGIYGFASFLDTYLAKALIVNNILFYTPLGLFILGLIDGRGYGHGFSIRVPVLAFLLFPLTIFSFGEWIWLYQVIYSLCAVVGCLLGALLCHIKNKSL